MSERLNFQAAASEAVKAMLGVSAYIVAFASLPFPGRKQVGAA